MFTICCEKSTVKWSRWIVKLDAIRHVGRGKGHSWFETGKPFRLIIDEKTSSIVGLSRVIHPHVSHIDMNEPFTFASKFKMSIVSQIVKSKSFHGGILNIASRRLQYFKPVQQGPSLTNSGRKIFVCFSNRFSQMTCECRLSPVKCFQTAMKQLESKRIDSLPDKVATFQSQSVFFSFVFSEIGKLNIYLGHLLDDDGYGLSLADINNDRRQWRIGFSNQTHRIVHSSSVIYYSGIFNENIAE